MIPSNVAVIDTETTGVDAKKDRIVEVGMFNDYNVEYETFVNPGVPIPPEVSAIHHIVDEDVADYAEWDHVKVQLNNICVANKITVLCAHNAGFDSEFLQLEGYEWICTYKAALRIWPDAPNHKNETLRYWLKLGDRGRRFMQKSHSALYDCRSTYLLLNELLKHATLDELIQWTKEPKMFSKIGFGKHAGSEWKDIDGGYLVWMCKQLDMDPDVVACAQRELTRRKNNATAKPR